MVLVGLLASASTVIAGSAPTVLAAQDQEPELAPERPAAQIVFAIADGDGAQPAETQIAERLASLGPVVTVALTFVATVEVILRVGARPILVDRLRLQPAISNNDNPTRNRRCQNRWPINWRIGSSFWI